MIRTVTENDTSSVVGLAVSSGLFPAEATFVVERMMAEYFGGKIRDGHGCVVDDDVELRAVAYYAPAPATDRTWYLTMIAVQGGEQGRGRGAALLGHVERALRADDQRLLLVETSGVPSFERTRRFYRKCGYGEEARVRDYYAPGEDMVLFRKDLLAP